MPRLVLLADDLTGALDAAAPFAVRGLRVVVATGLAGLPAARAMDADVLALSLNSRELGKAQAREMTEVAVAALQGLPIFCKVDSRLKGPIAAELSVLARARSATAVLLCPAIPELGRVVQGGAVRGQGIAQPIPLAGCLADLRATDPELQQLMPDAATDDDLDRILALAGPDTVLAGARGLAAALARQLVPQPRTAPDPMPLPGPIALAIGSRDPITLAQVAALRVALPGASWTAAPDGHPTGAIAAAAVSLVQATVGPGGPADPARVAGDLARAFARHVARSRPATLVLTGGETAAAVMAAMGMNLLDLLGEVQPGLPLCRPLDFPDPPLIVTKSGGFGDSTCLLRLVPAAVQDQVR